MINIHLQVHLILKLLWNPTEYDMYQDSILIENSQILNKYNEYFSKTWSEKNIPILEVQLIEEQVEDALPIYTQTKILSQDTLNEIANILPIEYTLNTEDTTLINIIYTDISEFLLKSKCYNQINDIGFAAIFNESQTYNQFQHNLQQETILEVANNDVPTILCNILPTVNYSPKGSCENDIISLIKNAKQSILIQMFSLSKEIYVKALSDAQKRNVQIDIIIEPAHKRFFINIMKDLNIELPYQLEKVHTKLMIVDTKIVTTCSFNWSEVAQKNNYENSIIIESETLAQYYTSFHKYIKYHIK